MNSTKDYKYTIDGKPYTFTGFIEKGKEFGFKSEYGFASTSMVASYLRRIGHQVGEYKK